jgi:hypothetical protein
MYPSQIYTTFERGRGIFRLFPNFVPYRFNQAGGRLHLHPHDLFPLGLKYGSVKERWFSSVIQSYRVEGDTRGAPPEIGLSYVETEDGTGDRFPFREAVEALGPSLVGETLWEKYGTWPMHAKFFDYRLPLFHHLHLDQAAAARVGKLGKPEAYYYPLQLNQFPGEFPLTYFGFDPSVTKDQVRERLLDWENRDGRLTELSRAYRIELGTGWYTPPGVLHAPGSYLTYEPQWNSTAGAVFENISSGEINALSALTRNVPEEKQPDIEAILDLLDWEENTDPLFREHYFRPPVPCPTVDERWTEKWIAYGNKFFSAKEFSLTPGQQAVVRDPAAYGCVVIQGHGQIGPHAAEAAGMLRFGQASADEFFVSQGAAREGVMIANHSPYEPLVLLKHFGPDHLYEHLYS